jgi:pyruvate dehydrogenase E1 component
MEPGNTVERRKVSQPEEKRKDREVDLENKEWLESLEFIFQSEGPERVRDIIRHLQAWALKRGVRVHRPANTPYINTIPADKQPIFPGDRAIERRIKSIIRWNAMVMVVRANLEEEGIGGHISTFSSAATLFEIGFNHFFKAGNENQYGDIVYFQGHASPGIYARAFLEGRLSEADLSNFRRELRPGGGLSSYPHPWLMPDFWQFPTVSMGLTPITAIYQARFNHYLQDRGLQDNSGQKVWAFLGDGEMDEPESLGAITLAAREKLDNLIFVINCNLQRLDGPVRGNGKIIQELEAAFTGAGWNVIKVVWGSDWDPLLEKDDTGILMRRMEELVDGQMQRYTVSDGAYIRQDFFGKYPELLKMVEHLSDVEVRKLVRGGHDPQKVYTAYKAAVEHEGSPTVILAQTIKGYGLGEAGEGRNVTHQQKKLNEEEMREFRSRFDIPLSDDDVARAPFYRPPDNSDEIRYLQEKREALGGYLPRRRVEAEAIAPPADELFSEYFEGTGERQVSTTMVFVHLLSKLLRDERIGKRIVPIVPDEARTFGMESLFKQVGIYSHVGQNYDPVDKEMLLYYKEASDGAILEEGITEAGSMCSFIAAGTSYATHGIYMIPFFIFYSMFGFQRIGDLIWAAADMRTKGFLIGGTSGRTTLAGEGLQHQDGHSHLLAYPVPNLRAYDPAWAYELAVIIKDGIRRMYQEGEDIFFYLTVTNEFYKMPPMPEGVEDGILRGMYRFRKSEKDAAEKKAHLLGSGAILNEAIRAADILENKYDVSADVWSVTSYKELYRDAMDTERENMLNSNVKPNQPYIGRLLSKEKGVFVAASDYVKTLSASIARWIPGRTVTLGTDGFGRSDSRAALRDFFEVDHRFIALGALHALSQEGKVEPQTVQKAIKDLDIDPNKPNPVFL